MLTNPEKTRDEAVAWIKRYFEENGPNCDAVVGISGGKDSSIVAALCVEALGKERVVGVLMPNGDQNDISDSRLLVQSLGIRSYEINISGAVNGLMAAGKSALCNDVSEQARTNLPARIRMATLYMVAQMLPNGGRVANTCNRSEDFVGYSTKFGDNAGDFSPLSYLLKHEVVQIGQTLNIPQQLVTKEPSDGLCGKTDEENLGFSYEQLDNHIMTGTCGIAAVDDLITVLHARSRHKMLDIPSFFPCYF